MKIFISMFAIFLVTHTVFAAQEEFSLLPGEYHLLTEVKFENRENILEQSDRYILSYKDTKVYLSDSDLSDPPLVGELSSDMFFVYHETANGTLKMEGSVVEDNHVIGQIEGNGKEIGRFTGSFELIPCAEW